MKHLLIILSFLLLSSPVIGDSHKGETLYKWETPSGRVWKGFGDKDTQSVYKGEVENGVPNGLGFVVHQSGGKFVGSWINGEYDKGTLYYHDGEKYVGSWEDRYMDNISFTWKIRNYWNGIMYKKNGDIKHKYVNGEPIE